MIDKIVYFDLGTAYNGNELKTMLDHVFPTLKLRYECHCFEGNKENYEKVKERFARYHRVYFYNLIISESEGKKKLFYADNPSGHSIYQSKKNVGDEYEIGISIRFSKWLKNQWPGRINLTDTSTLNILRYNIEGAELDLFRDLDKEDLFKLFKIIRGSSGNDILKCSEIADKITEFQDICRKNNIPLEHKWSWKEPEKMIQWILLSIEPDGFEPYKEQL